MSTFIAIGIVCMLAISTLRQDALSGTNAALGQAIFDVYQWTFRLGPGFIVGVGNGLILGWLHVHLRLGAPRLALFGLVGGPLVIISGVLRVILDVIKVSARGYPLWDDDPGDHLGAGDRHLPHRQGLQELVSGTCGGARGRTRLARLRALHRTRGEENARTNRGVSAVSHSIHRSIVIAVAVVSATISMSVWALAAAQAAGPP